MVLTLLQNAFPKAILRLERLLGRRLEHIMPNIRGREGPLGPNVFHLLPDIEVSASVGSHFGVRMRFQENQ